MEILYSNLLHMDTKHYIQKENSDIFLINKNRHDIVELKVNVKDIHEVSFLGTNIVFFNSENNTVVSFDCWRKTLEFFVALKYYSKL